MKSKPKHVLHKNVHPNSIWVFVALASIAIGFIVYSVKLAQESSPTIVTNAAKPNFLTPGDDILSLESDLERLKTDPAASEMNELENQAK